MTGTSCYLGLGSNLNSPKRHIRLAYQTLRALPQTHILSMSSLYQSRPAGVVGQPDYCNAVVHMNTRLPAHTLLKYCQKIETAHGRVRKKRWGSRTLDIDILLYGKQSIHTPELTIPHPRLHERDFMLTPLLELWPEAHLPNHTRLDACLLNLKHTYL
ncbi:MAG: 2-amino-4-hydroxy-6-hydroxymethyldihydropteridine diphosphokinase [Legionella sp.]|jgi:2-amino-4-hydroxy-6-hydroxymethyldihydropteridine diphosphokinase|nr:2-amino-4-hydroxy-6-hydroxymethyldihydropteridine diphosphokinase [Legionella sp.]